MPWILFAMCLLLGVGSFAVGMLPLSFVFAKHYVIWLSTLGTGLLLGTALGVTIPEGIEHVVEASHTEEPPVATIALTLLGGFILMLYVETFAASHSHSHGSPAPPYSAVRTSAVEFDAELGDLEMEQGGRQAATRRSEDTNGETQKDPASQAKAFPLTIGLLIHALADGLALGASFIQGDKDKASGAPKLSIIVFLALLIHKAPTALALTTALMATSLPRADCRKHLAAFCASTPVGATVSYFILRFLGGTADWAGTALLLSGGTFLYVATVLQPVSGHGEGDGQIGKFARVGLMTVGMVLPFLLGVIFGHGHD
ncbi:hypothetical protein HGRIS_005974 [Hohenbuehelia grisea]|uniref:Zinc/iron permease n=1 Tax=Hohenbuehelia grisea TaxID=104357 RepID=A0ABR3JYE3_9AGAR